MTKLNPIADYILVSKSKYESDSKIIIPDIVKHPTPYINALVVGVGATCEHIKVVDVVYLDSTRATQVEFEGVIYGLLRETVVFGTITEESVQ